MEAMATTTPPTWSPGAASAGTVSRKGTTTVDGDGEPAMRAGTVTVAALSNRTHAPASIGRWPLGRRTKPPSVVVVASVAKRRMRSGLDVSLVNATWSSITWPGMTS
ncbi:unannotated protein [freshwater metagenome]|uniref:Unannotated protein n=1 Tax=freshwater metagenome TaxID=449393 RepID=A0A6J7C0D4_9ZZZZ